MNSTPPQSAAPARPPSLSQRVVEGVLARIENGELKPGERVPTEPELMRAFGVSRSVVREAISRLQAGGLVRTQHGVGSFVLAPQPALPLITPPDAAPKLQQKLAMLELRLSLEADAAALAAQRRTPTQLQAMERAIHDYETQLASGGDSAEADFRFHELMAQATGNEYFVHVLRTLSVATIPRPAAQTLLGERGTSTKGPRFGETSPQLRARKEIAAQEHRAVLDAIRRGDAAASRAAMYTHLSNSRERMKNAAR